MSLRHFGLWVICLCLWAALSVTGRAEDPVQAPPPPPPAPVPAPAPAPAKPPGPLDLLDPNQRVLLNAARWLARPASQDEALQGLTFQPCPLPPLGAEAKGKLTTPELLRLWGLLEAGWPDKPALTAQVERLMKTKAPKVDSALGPLTAQALCIRAAARAGLVEDKQYKSFLRDAWRTAEGASAPTATKGPWADDKKTQPQWYANVLWRALLMRCMVDAGLAQTSSVLAKDIEALIERAGASNRFQVDASSYFGDKTETLHVNLFGFAALKVVAACGDKLLSKPVADKLQTVLGGAKATLDTVCRLTWFWRGGGGYRGARGTLGCLIGPEAMPGVFYVGETFVPWAQAVQRVCQRLDGGFDGNVDLCQHLGLAAEPSTFAAADASLVETALTVSLLVGGLFAKDRTDLSATKPEVCEQLVSLLIATNAAQARKAPSGTFERQVGHAILDGCDYLIANQQPDGAFGTSGNTRMGLHGLCLMALLHGGHKRDSEAVRRGLVYLEAQKWGFLSPGFNGFTYDAAILLMFLQLYYEPELLRSGMMQADTPKKYEAARKAMNALVAEPHRLIVLKLLDTIGAFHTGAMEGWTYRKYEGMKLQHGDNSNSQYAMLGYKAGALLGAEFDDEVFAIESRRLIEQQVEISYLPAVPAFRREDLGKPLDDRKKTDTRGTIKPASWGYMCGPSAECLPQMVAASMSSLMICLDELKLRGKLEKALETKVEAALNAGLATLQSTYYQHDGGNELWGELSETMEGWGLFYNLYAIERGCVLAGAKYLGGKLDWHRIGSEILIGLQGKDGSWRGRRYEGAAAEKAAAASEPPRLVDTCLAILFLKAAAMPVITESGSRKKPEEPKAPEGN